jgi:hypothetical protein
MHTFMVRPDRYGWTVRLGSGVTTHFRSRDQAVAEADRLCGALRRHGEVARVVIDHGEVGEAPRRPERPIEAPESAFWVGPRATAEADGLGSS